MLSLAQNAQAAGSLKAVPRISLRYSFNDNVDAVDVNSVGDPVKASYLDYLLGLALSYQQGRGSITIGGYVGYEQYLTVEGGIEDQGNTSPQDYNSMTAQANITFAYAQSRYTFELSDNIVQTRDLQQVFGSGTDALDQRFLYTDNTIALSIRYGINRSRFLFRYQYESLIFTEPENKALSESKPADSFEHRVFLRGEYDFTKKTAGIADLQYAARTFEETTDNMTGQKSKAADYNLFQVMAGLRYAINQRMWVEALGGAAIRHFDNLSEATLNSPPFSAGTLAYDLTPDTTDPLARIIFHTGVPKRYTLDMNVEQGISTYGQNLFFTYTGGSVHFVYNFNPKLYFDFRGRYQRALFDLERNSREWLWREDRVDLVTWLNALVHWDILQKGGEGTLSLEAGYTYNQRDSSVNGPSDYTATFRTIASPASLRSYDTVVGIYYIQVQMLPSILIGN